MVQIIHVVQMIVSKADPELSNQEARCWRLEVPLDAAKMAEGLNIWCHQLSGGQKA